MLKQILLGLIIMMISTNFSKAQFSNFITRSGDKIYDGDKEFRFISFNVPNLLLIEDNVPFTEINQWRIPSEFEIRDALLAVKQMGGKVARSYVLSVRRDADHYTYPRHVDRPGQFNEDLFISLDKVIQIANELEIRLIIPFVDNWHWMGGVSEYAAFRGKDRSDFWDDDEIISDFKRTIEFTINRINTFTGIPYKEDKSILAWETGNELEPHYEWTAEISEYIKSLAPNQLVFDGAHRVMPKSIENPIIDMVTTHHYSPGPRSVEVIMKTLESTKGKKPYFVGEFGFMPVDHIEMVLDTVINNGISGALGWSLRFRNRDGGFYYHTEPNGDNQPYRWPGFNSGNFYNERTVLNLFKNKADKINGFISTVDKPISPELLPISHPSEITWRGSAGAEHYIVERKDSIAGDWKVISDSVNDADIAYRPIYNDTSAAEGNEYFYRVSAINQAGKSLPSNEVGPVRVEHSVIIDEFENFQKLYQYPESARILIMEDIRKVKEDKSRLLLKSGESIIYFIDGKINQFIIDIFKKSDKSLLNIYAGSNEYTLQPISFEKTEYQNLFNDYGFFTGERFIVNQFPAEFRYIKISAGEEVQLCRSKITYMRN
jgi:hypothetical protein